MMNLLYAGLGSLGFGMISKANKNKYVYITIGGVLNYLAYYLSYKYTNNIFLASAVCAVVTKFYSNIMATILKCPTTIFTLTGLIPIVPGGSLFYMMQNLVLSNSNEAIKQGIITVEVILGIVSGMLFASSIIAIIKTVMKKINILKNR